MGFQREGIKFALKRGGRLLVGDEMGELRHILCLLLELQYKHTELFSCTQLTCSVLARQPAIVLTLHEPHEYHMLLIGFC